MTNPLPVEDIDTRAFYELHQAYRHAKHDPVMEYAAILKYIARKLQKARAEALRESAEDAEKYIDYPLDEEDIEVNANLAFMAKQLRRMAAELEGEKK